MKKDFLLIVNPIAGSGKALSIARFISQRLPHNSVDIKVTQYPLHAKEITEEQINNYNFFVAVGGDGTVNEIASVIIEKNTGVLVPLPLGSGNALALSLGYTKKLHHILKKLTSGKTKSIDVGQVNDRYFFNTFGVGFDARVAEIFQTSSRGLFSYIKIALAQMIKYTPFQIQVNGKNYTSVLVDVTNSGQFGNNFYVNKASRMDDGLLEMVLIKKFSLLDIVLKGSSFLNKGIAASQQAINLQGKNFDITLPYKTVAHCDGEVFYDSQFKIKILSRRLQVLC